VKLTTQLHLVPMLRISGATLHSPIRLHGVILIKHKETLLPTFAFTCFIDTIEQFVILHFVQ